MRIIVAGIYFGYLALLVAASTATTDQQRVKKKEKRTPSHQYSLAYPYSPVGYRSERRISTISGGGIQYNHNQLPQLPSIQTSSSHHLQYLPSGLPPLHNYRKGRPYVFPAVPPYAVQMEPLVHYSQRDPLYDTNNLSPNLDNDQNLISGDSISNSNRNSQELSEAIDRGGHADSYYQPHHKPLIKVVEKPVYIKEPEPIIEIIIKESNISLPAPPTPPPTPPPKKKKEEVKVFYVKYRKNPNGHGKNSVIYEKPIPAISPVVPDEPEPETEWKQPDQSSDSYGNEVTEGPPRPSTTLRTIIKPDSELYHSPGNNIKVTFGKEGFDYSKRSSKPEEIPRSYPVPEGRQLTSYSNVYFKRPATNHYQSSASEYKPEFRAPQPYRPFVFPQPTNQYSNRSPHSSNNRPPPAQSQSSPFYAQNKSPPPSPPLHTNTHIPSFPNFSHSISHPPPPQFQSQRPKFSQPVHHHNNYHQPPPSSHTPPQFQPQSQFSEVPPPSQRKPVPYTPFEQYRPTFSQPLPAPAPHQTINNAPQQSVTFNQPSTSNQQSQLPSHIKPNIQFRPETHFNVQQNSPPRPTSSFAQVNNQFNTIESIPVQQQPQQFSSYNQQHNNNYREQINNFQGNQNSVVPPGGELIPAVPKYEQHLVVDQQTGKLTPAAESSVHSQIQSQSQFGIKQGKSHNIQAQPSLYLRPSGPSNSFIGHQHQIKQQSSVSFVTQRAVTTTTPTPSPTTTTTTTTTQKPSTTTKDSKILEAQLPDEVPDDLREQLLSSGILNNADISILDYDKVGDIPLSALPPDQLANFYNAGGAQQIAAAGSESQPQTLALTASNDDQEMDAQETGVRPQVIAKPQNVEMKIVKYDAETEKGKQVQQTYVNEEAPRVDPVVLNDNSYNRYLPLKVNGNQFPIPDVPELKGKRISSVVVLTPIDISSAAARKTRDASASISGTDAELIQNAALRKLLENPTLQNYEKFLEHENKTSPARQAIVLLVTGSNDRTDNTAEKEIFMYDIPTKTVSKLSGELSSAFVEAAEANSSDEDIASVPKSKNDTESSVEPVTKNHSNERQ